MASGRLARWRPGQPNADQRLQQIAADHLRALHETLQADPSAFGLYDVACAAGARLSDTMGSLAQDGPQSAEAFVARLTKEVGGDGGTLADAAVRRAAAASGRDVLERHPELKEALDSGSGGAGDFAWDILCDLYQLFFADLVAEFLRSVVTEQVKLAVPVLVMADPEGRIADWIAEKLLELVPSPCEEATEAAEFAQAEDTARSVTQIAEDPASVLPEVARRLVPGAVGKVLGLVAEEIIEDGGEAA